MKAHFIYMTRISNGRAVPPAECFEVKDHLTVLEHKQMLKAKFSDGSTTLVRPDEIVIEEE